MLGDDIVIDTEIPATDPDNQPMKYRLATTTEAGDARSQVLLGLVYEMGTADEKPQPVEALKWFLKAADQRIAWAEVWAADFYFSGSPGVPLQPDASNTCPGCGA